VTTREADSPSFEGVAIIGMAGRFPGAGSVVEFWHNQLHGIESISSFQIEDLEISNAAEVANDPNYVRARSILEDVDLFDAEFFDIYPREAALMDPQHRLFLECCWQAFEDAGYDPFVCAGEVGVYAGNAMPTYFLSQLCARPGFIQNFTGGYQVGNYTEMLGSSLDFLATRVSYKLNLRGPSFTVLSACSTSLLAVTQACQSLLTYQSDMALAGGASITFPQKRGYYHQEGGMVSPDGHCRTFDADARGTVFGSGVGVVLLKRLEEAMRDGDQIYAVIRGFGVNNDGSTKVGYTAPSVEGQARVIALAQEAAGVDPETIGYIEAHGTGTPLGDPIELAGLTQAFRARTQKKQFCTIGSVKTNIGHLDVGAGITGLINATQIVRHGIFPPTLHFKKPNPQFDLASSPFRVNTSRSEWKTNGTPRRAGVSAFGVGGTNAHVVLEQAPVQSSSLPSRDLQLLVLSARSEGALDCSTDNLAAFLKTEPDTNLADAAWTLQVGRRAFRYRRTVVARDLTEAISALSQRDRGHVQTRLHVNENPSVCFMFPGQGSQHPNMGREIYEAEPVFRDTVDQCAKILQPHLGEDLRTLLYPAEGASDKAKRRVTETVIAQPAIFTIEYALAQLWMNWGIRPQTMLGHSVGEFVAACLAGVFSLEDALALIATRGRMMQEIPQGGMLSVRLPESELVKRLNGKLSIAAVNSPSLCVVAGPFDSLEGFERDLGREGLACRRLVTSHAFHSAMMDPLIEPFAAKVGSVRLNSPQIPYISGVTGTWICDDEATDPAYWARHARESVRFSAAVMELRKNPGAVLVEVGPGNVLSTLARQHAGDSTTQVIVSSLSDGFSGEGDLVTLLNALGALWLGGVQPNWEAFHGGRRRRRISLPSYPFERKRYWLEPRTLEGAPPTVAPPLPIEIVSPATQEGEPVNVIANFAAASEPSAEAAPRAKQIRAALIGIFEDLSGKDLAATDHSETFLEMGFDSLFLTQVTQSIQNKYGVKITFRQLLGDQSTLEALTTYLDSKLPADAFAAPATVQVAAASPAPPPTATALPTAVQPTRSSPTANGTSAPSESAVERLMREQHQAMNELFAKQLEMLRGSISAVQTAGPAMHQPERPAATGGSVPRVLDPTSAKSKDEFKAHGPYRPVQKAASGGLTDRQERHLRALIARHTKRTAKSKRMTEESRKPLADPRVVSGFRRQWKELVYPVITHRSQGSHLWDIDGNEYIDLVNGFGPIMLGHRPPFVEKAIAKQLQEGFETGPQTPLASEVAKIFCEMTGNERMTFCNTGSEAVMAALRVARTVTGRSKVVMFTGDYHGMFDEVLVKGFINKAGVPQSVPVAPGIPRESVSNMIVLEYGTPESLTWIRQNAQELAAVLVEPVQSRHPALQPIEFLKEIRQITQGSGTVFIFDEVVTGFRVHPGGCQALFGIKADLATYGKVVAGGMPIGVLAGKARFMDALDGGMWQFGDESYPEIGVTFFAGTFVRHPLAVAAMKAVLQHLKEQGPALQVQLTERTTRLVRTINAIFEQRGLPTRLESFGSFFYLGFPSDEPFANLFYFYMRDKGIHIREGFPCFLTTAHADADLEKVVQAFKESVIEMQEAGFLSEPITASPGTTDQNTGGTTGAEESRAPMTESQREIFLAAVLGDDASCAYNESFSLHLRGKLQVEALRAGLNALVMRHEALRATVDPDGTTLHFLPELKLEVPLRDLTDFDPFERDAELKRLLAEDARRPFDLVHGPMIRAQIVRIELDYYVLMVTSHHIVCDGWSTNVLIDELAKVYTATVEGGATELPPVIRFSDYARTLSANLASAENARIEAYWLSQFADVPVSLELRLDRPRPSVKSYNGATFRMNIDADSYRHIKQLGSKRGCTLFVTLLAGFKALLHRLSNYDDIVVGIPAAGQSSIEGGDLVGHCVNFLPLRTRFGRDLSFSALLTSVKKTLLDAYDNQPYTYGTLVRKLAIRRDPSRLPLTEVQFNLESIGGNSNFTGLSVKADPNPKHAVNFDIFLNVIESEQGLVIDCDYNTDLFERSTVERWLKQYETLLLSAVPNPNELIDALPLVPSSGATVAKASSHIDEQQLLDQWNNTGTDYPRDKSIVQVFEAQVARTPNAVAVSFGDKSISYRELNTKANQLARHLRRLGINTEDMVVCCLERSIELIIALIGVLKAGGAYVPLDPTLPKERLDYILSDTRGRVMLSQKKLIDLGLAKLNISSIALDDPNSPIWTESEESYEKALSPENMAYVIYTSGSTGRPKGVAVEHRAVIRLVKNTNYCDFNSDQVFLQFAPISFDASTFEIWGALLNGGRLVLVPNQALSLEELGRVIRDNGVTTVWLTAGLFHVMVERHLADLGSLSQLLAGGDVLSPWHVQQVLNKLPHVRLINGYGPTEATTFTCCHPFAPEAPVVEPLPIGRPIANSRVYILDSALRPVPIGQAGELFIGGDGLARGYLNNSELTAEKFITHQLSNGAVERLYRTGDQARFLPDGSVQFLGRTDNQIKLRGYRIELDEIEVVLRRHAGVRQACVVAEREGVSVRRLLAYCVPAENANLDETTLREHLLSILPQYMIPSAFILLNSLPLTPTGKVDKQKLPSPDFPDQAQDHVAPTTPQEKCLAAIVSEVLRIENVGTTDNLFQLGADSLQVFQITSRAAKQGLPVTPRLVLQHRTIAEVLSAMNASQSQPRAPSTTITRVARQKYRAPNHAS
jgi:amino acid adenylation domain-containing protein